MKRYPLAPAVRADDLTQNKLVIADAFGNIISSDYTIGELDHGNLLGLVDDDHTAYHTDARGDDRYSSYKRLYIFNECLKTIDAYSDPWFGYAVSSGTNVAGGALCDANHPGVLLLRSSGTNNSGYRFQSNYENMVLGGGERSDMIVYFPLATETITVRAGFHDAYSITDAVDGAYFEAISDGTNIIISGKTAAASTRSTTGTSYTADATTWYRLRVVVNADATLITYSIYNAAGALVWTDALATDIPTGLMRHGVVATVTPGIATGELVAVDYVDIVIDRELTR